MKRLTGWDGDRAYILGLKPFEMPVDEEAKIRAVVERLAAYEDIGIEPNTLVEEIHAADVRPVVLCGDCVYMRPDMFGGVLWCNCPKLNPDMVYENFFCAYGKRKEDGTDV